MVKTHSAMSFSFPKIVFCLSRQRRLLVPRRSRSCCPCESSWSLRFLGPQTRLPPMMSAQFSGHGHFIPTEFFPIKFQIYRGIDCTSCLCATRAALIKLDDPPGQSCRIVQNLYHVPCVKQGSAAREHHMMSTLLLVGGTPLKEPGVHSHHADVIPWMCSMDTEFWRNGAQKIPG